MLGQALKRHPARDRSRTLLFMSMVVCLLLAGPACGEIYRWVDENGKAHFGDRPPPDAATETLELKINTYESVEVHHNPKRPDKGIKRRQGAKRVVMYSAEWCGACRKAKSYFKKKKIPFQELDIDKSEQARNGFEKLNGRGVPIILVGDKRMNGFDPDRFEELYAGAR